MSAETVYRSRPNADQMDELIQQAKIIGGAISMRADYEWLAMLNGSNYKTVMKSWFQANGAAAMADLSDLCDRWYTMTRTGWNGGVRFAIPAEGAAASSDGTKTGDNYGLSCTPSTKETANTDDYANLPLFACVDCNVYLDSAGKPHVTAIDGIAGNFKRSDPSKIVAVLQMTGWKKAVVDTTNGVYGWDYTDAENVPGYTPLPEAVELADNSVRPWVVHGKYSAGEGWTCCSNQKVKVFNVSHNTCRSGIRSAWGNRYCGFTSADSAFLQLMLYLKYGRLDSDRILVGCCDYNYDYTPAVAETGVERILLTTAQAANILVGSTVHLSTSARGGTAIVDRVKVKKVETVNVGGTDYGAVYVDNGGTTFNTATSNHLCTMQWYTGSTDGVLGSDGGINPSNGKYPVRLQGIEYMVGCYEVIGDTILNHETINSVAVEAAHICRDASKIAESITSDYIGASFGVPKPGSAGWQYPKQMREDGGLPELIYPIDIVGSSSAGPRDGFYLEAQSATGTREWPRFGALDVGVANAGLSCGRGYSGLSYAYWGIGGRLSVTGNRGEFQPAA
ncbi:MAG: hypothetical protein IKS55_02610 [Oscillospiraceae bacterium]|nr:hypothetical protein [Oscillospiraceae bacterium]